MTRGFLAITWVSLAGLALAAPAEVSVDETRPAAPDGVVAIDVGSGSLKVTGWDKPQISVRGTLGHGADELDFRVEGRHARIEVEGRFGAHVHADLEIQVPAGSDLEIDSFSADTSVTGVTGGVRAESVNGSISVSGVRGEVEISAVNGSLELSGESERVKAEAVNGPVTLRGVRGEVEASTVNGKLTVEGGLFERAKLETVDGFIRLSGDLAASARLEIESVSGGVELTLPASVSARFAVSSFSGDILNELGPAAQRASRWTTEQELEFTAGSGSANVDIQTLSGTISIRKKSK
jgi:DUF4097 and DUF4098 domain-containing protein YvlB